MIEILLITILVFLAYHQTINYSIIVDDVHWYDYIKGGVGSFSGWKNILKDMCLKLYGGATFGLNTKVDHSFSIFLHAWVCSLIYLAFGANAISLGAAILYAVHPINNQTAIWLNGRRYQINIILVLTMFYLAKITPLAIFLYFLTPAFQVTAIFSPLLLVNYSPLYLFAIALVSILAQKHIREKVEYRSKNIFDDDRKNFEPKRVIVIVKYYGHFFFKMLFPGVCVMVYKRLHYWGRTPEGNKDAYAINFDFAKGIFGIILSIAGCWLLPVSLRPMLAFMFLSTLQWCAIIPVTHDLADRYAALPNVFMMFFVSYLAQTYLGQYAIPALALLTGAYLSDLLKTMPMYKDYNATWDFHRYFNADVPSPRKQEIKWHMQRKDLTRAWVLIREGLQHTPKDFQLLYDAAVCHYRIGESGLAKDFAKQAMENYFLGTEKQREPEMQAFLKHIEGLGPKRVPNADLMNRQQRRAERMVAV